MSETKPFPGMSLESLESFYRDLRTDELAALDRENALLRALLPKPANGVIGGGSTVRGQILWLLENEGPRTTEELKARMDCDFAPGTLSKMPGVTGQRLAHSNVKRWSFKQVVALVALAVCLIGCQTSPVKPQAIIAPPPLPVAMRSAVLPHQAAIVAPAPPKTIGLAWDKNDPHPETVTQVWQTTDLQDWTLFGEYGEPHCTVTANQSQQFFKIRNRNGAEFSDWDRKGTP